MVVLHFRCKHKTFGNQLDEHVEYNDPVGRPRFDRDTRNHRTLPIGHIVRHDRPKRRLVDYHRRPSRVDIHIVRPRHSNMNRRYDNWSCPERCHTIEDNVECLLVALVCH